MVTSKSQVVVVERDSNQRLLYEWELADAGYRVATCARPRLVSGLPAHSRPDVLVVDASFGEREVRALRRAYPSAVVVVHSACMSVVRSGHTQCADALLLKSSDMTVLKTEIQRLLGKGPMRAGQRQAAMACA